jgi:hypothetical protein
MSFQKYGPPLRGQVSPVEAERAWFAALLWRAFPSSSENELSEAAAAVLGVSARQVRNWLRCEHDARWRHVVMVLVIAGGEVVLSRLEARR